MTNNFEGLPFQPANILLPRDCDLSLWSVVACDQYTSRPEYWQRVENRVGRAPSALRLILPESCLEGPSVETDIMEINNTMSRYLREGRFQEYPDALIYVERTLSGGYVRRGLVGMVDLEQYDYEAGSRAAVRATEGVVMSRIPPRVAVRKNAPIELPHALLLTDCQDIIPPLSGETEGMELLYDFDLMEGGGHLKGWLLTREQQERTARAIRKWKEWADRERDGLLFLVGDGNHSLATAKECYERRKGLTDPAQWPELPSRYALCELVNFYDGSVELEPIHRVVFGAKPEELLDALLEYYTSAVQGGGEGHTISFAVNRWSQGEVTVREPSAQLPVDTLQRFLDDYIAAHPRARIDYIHGAEEAKALAQEREDAVAFLLPPPDWTELFDAIVRDGVLPRKTFSIGQAQDKRFYLEARKIRK
ncbi:MAG: DUF1015 domain-containing protein [Lawsonibacter sp.]|jgi:uncharacterized protein (DUF1015 family)|nr:DUF1015 domain-containing protein [Lawsonibacter sp.]MCI9656590.1 DUF1015 domain-containing protein [Lawsonibacter sp.]